MEERIGKSTIYWMNRKFYTLKIKTTFSMRFTLLSILLSLSISHVIVFSFSPLNIHSCCFIFLLIESLQKELVRWWSMTCIMGLLMWCPLEVVQMVWAMWPFHMPIEVRKLLRCHFLYNRHGRSLRDLGHLHWMGDAYARLGEREWAEHSGCTTCVIMVTR